MIIRTKGCTYPNCSCNMGTGCKQRKRNIEKHEQKNQEEQVGEYPTDLYN